MITNHLLETKYQVQKQLGERANYNIKTYAMNSSKIVEYRKMLMNTYKDKINAQYDRGNIEEKIFSALKNADKDINSITLSELAGLDELHIGGRQATLKLADFVKPLPNDKILDVGSGLGGPARILSSKFGSEVVGIDITEEFCKTAEVLTKLTGLSSKVKFRCADALNIPFEDQSFDIVWSQHCSMNIKDKNRLYAEFYRVLKKRGRLVIHDVITVSDEPLFYPVPWANEPSVSFLLSEKELRETVKSAGFTELSRKNISEESLQWYNKAKANRKKGITPHILGPQIVFGTDIRDMAANMKRNIEEKRAAVAEYVLVRSK